MLSALPHASAVVDEPAHLTSGYLALAQGDLRVNREHPPLVKLIAALPLLFLAPALPPREQVPYPPASEDFEFGYSRLFLYRTNDADQLLGVARLPIVLLTVLAGIVLVWWSRALHGSAASAPGWGPLVALGLFAFEPNILAHGRLVTTDLGATLFGLAALACMERSLAVAPARRGWVVAGGLSLGLALMSRFSCALLLPLMAGSVAIDGRQPVRRRAAILAACVAIGMLTVGLGYGAAGRASPGSLPALFPFAAEPVGGPLKSGAFAAIEAHPTLRWVPLPLPRLYLEGLDLARYKNSQVEGPGYLNGEYSSQGWWSYFLLALCMKVTLPMLALAAAGMAALAAPRPGWPARTLAAYVLLPAIGWLALVTTLTRAQIGLRYVLPAIPFLCLLGGLGQARWLTAATAGPKGALKGPARALGLTALAGLLAWHSWAAVSIHPYHLAYFNEAAGGPSRGYEHLVDSNLDWGQDLIGLRRFMQEGGLTRINLYYFGTADPEYYGINRAVPPEPGLFAVSATHLMGVYLPDRDYLAPFRQMTPTTTIGHSILVYRLDRVPDFLKTPIRRP